MKKIFIVLSTLFIFLSAKADEGMWILKELNRQSAERMQELGFTFPIDSIYSEENPSLKDAVVIFGRGCTGVAVSDKGLIFTNHHCGYDAIQKHSAVEHDYLKDGFVSQGMEEELYTEDLYVSFLQKTEDVTERVTTGVNSAMTEKERTMHVDSISKLIIEEYKDNEFLNARIVPFYSGNKYYLIVYEVFKDVRMVFAPPSSVGKFGGETDNWMWPRQTGDFSVFRVYANKENKAANYSPDNVPYKPRYTVPVSLKGFEENDYAMTIGYPGSTDRYLSSWGVKQLMESTNSPRIEVRTVKQDIWREAMNASDETRIKYASKYAISSNYWKNAIGMNTALTKLGVVNEKEKLESQFRVWLTGNPTAQQKYGKTLDLLQQGYTGTMEPAKMWTYFVETFYSGIEIVRFASVAINVDKDNAQAEADAIRGKMAETYKDYEPELDRKVAATLLEFYRSRVPAAYLPDIYTTIDNKFKGNYSQYADWLYKNTAFTSLDKLTALIRKGKQKDIDNDPAVILAKSVAECRSIIGEELNPYNEYLEKGERQFMAGLMEMQPEKAFSPDANFTQRLSYGSVMGYIPFDAAVYDYYSTSKGILEKQKPGDPEFGVQEYILDAIRTANWGIYGDKDGKMHVNFLSNNDITGGNSGSPVFNGQAELIGLAFDGNWEALSGDIVFEKDMQRTISVDIRYVLYIIDKVMNCPRLINELDIRYPVVEKEILSLGE